MTVSLEFSHTFSETETKQLCVNKWRINVIPVGTSLRAAILTEPQRAGGPQELLAMVT